MTVTAGTSSKKNQVSDGNTSVFFFDFKLFEDSHMVVYENGVITDKPYTVTGASPDPNAPVGGSIDFSPAAADAGIVTMSREMPFDQDADYSPFDPFPSATHERQLDKAALERQELLEKNERSLKVNISSDQVDIQLPEPEENKVLAWKERTTEPGKYDIINSENDVDSSAASAASAAASAAAALASESGATISALNAAASEAAAAASESSAAASEAAAQAAVDSLQWEVLKLTFADSPYAATIADQGRMLTFDTSGGPILVNLPSIAGVGEPFNIAIKKSTADANAVNVFPNGTDTIDGSSSDSIGSVGSVQYYADIDTTPDNWETVASGSASGNMSDETFEDGVDFTAGASTQITLANVYGSEQNIWLYFDGVKQGPEEYSLSGTIVSFTSPIPEGVEKVYVKGGTVLSIGTPADGSVETVKLANNAATLAKMDDTGSLGQVLTAQGAGVDPVWATSSNVESVTKTDTFSTTSTSFVDITDLSVTITPSSTSDKIEVSFSLSSGASAAGVRTSFRLLRDATPIGVGAAAGSRIQASTWSRIAQTDEMAMHSFSIIDEPATTSAVTYKVQMLVNSGTGYVGRTHDDGDAVTSGRTASTLIAKKV